MFQCKVPCIRHRKRKKKKVLCPNSQLLGREEQRCSLDSCANRGVCVQQWNTFFCYCQLTSYSGPTCSDGISYSHSTAFVLSREKLPSSSITDSLVPLSLVCAALCSR